MSCLPLAESQRRHRSKVSHPVGGSTGGRKAQRQLPSRLAKFPVLPDAAVPHDILPFPPKLMVPGKEGGVPLAPNQPAHGAQADQERLATYTLSDGAHCAATPSSR